MIQFDSIKVNDSSFEVKGEFTVNGSHVFINMNDYILTDFFFNLRDKKEQISTLIFFEKNEEMKFTGSFSVESIVHDSRPLRLEINIKINDLIE